MCGRWYWLCMYGHLITIVIQIAFFFSSRRRHTRLQGDWSSDVCSSDLAGLERLARILEACWDAFDRAAKSEIGRASCRERVEISVVAGECEQKKRGGGVWTPKEVRTEAGRDMKRDEE